MADGAHRFAEASGHSDVGGGAKWKEGDEVKRVWWRGTTAIAGGDGKCGGGGGLLDGDDEE